MPAREFRAALESLRIAVARATADIENVVKGWRQSAQIVSLSAEHAARAGDRAGLSEAASTLSQIAARAKDLTALSGSEALQRIRDVGEALGRIDLPEMPSPDE
jgi:methyl-accepting chemotaxis protein